MPHLAGWRFGRVEAIRKFAAAGEYPPRRSRAPARDPARRAALMQPTPHYQLTNVFCSARNHPFSYLP